MGIEEHDKEGRVITLEFSEFYIVNVYTPNSKQGWRELIIEWFGKMYLENI